MVEANPNSRDIPEPVSPDDSLPITRRRALKIIALTLLGAAGLYEQLSTPALKQASINPNDPLSSLLTPPSELTLTPAPKQPYKRRSLDGVFIKGVHLPSWQQEELLSPSAEKTIQGLISEVNANMVIFTPTWWQENSRSTAFKPSEKTPNNKALKQAIKIAHDAGLMTGLLPHVAVNTENPQNGWHGEIGINFTPKALTDWFRNYREMIFGYAELGEETQTELLGVGGEYYSLTTSSKIPEWVQVIEGIQKRFHGATTYAAFKKQELASFPLWGKLDIVGANLYDDIATTATPTLDNLISGVQTLAASVRTIMAKIGQGKKLFIPEVGYYAARGAGKDPWRYASIYDSAYPLDLQQQSNCAKAFFEVMSHEPYWTGVAWWDRDIDPKAGGLHDKSYNYHDKPVQQVLAEFYKSH